MKLIVLLFSLVVFVELVFEIFLVPDFFAVVHAGILLPLKHPLHVGGVCLVAHRVGDGDLQGKVRYIMVRPDVGERPVFQGELIDHPFNGQSVERDKGDKMLLLRELDFHAFYSLYHFVEAVNGGLLDGLHRSAFVEEDQVEYFVWLLRLNQTLDPVAEKAPVMVFESNPYLEGSHLLSVLYRFVSTKMAIRVKYKPFFEKEKRFDFHPWQMKQYNQHWYLAGWNAGENGFNLLAIDRIVSVKASKIPFMENMDADFEEYFDDVVGVTVPEGIARQEVVLAVDPAQYPYISTKPIHPTQIKRKVPGKNGKVIVILKVIPNYELESLLLSFTPRVEVLEPRWLREKLAGKLACALSLYTEGGDGGRFSNLPS